MDLFALFGSGGYGREVMPLARVSAATIADGPFEVVFVQDVVPEDGSVCNGHRIMSTEEFAHAKAARKFFNVAVADGHLRESVADKLAGVGARPFTIRAPQSVELDQDTIGEGAILCSFTTVTSNARIGRFFHLNIYSYVAHDCRIGDFVTFGPNVHCNGNIMVEDHAYVGTGVIIKQGSASHPLVIGRGAVVGMGAVVTKSVEPFTTVVGNPARVFTGKGQD